MIDIKIIENNPDFVIADKPANANFHTEDDIAGFFVKLEQQLKQSLYPVHRLDKMTSGLIIAAKNKRAASQFGELFEQHTISKYYLAISSKKPTKKQGTIKGDMDKSRRGGWKLLKTHHNPAITQFFSTALTEGRRLIIARPLSGKTHQIRVAMKSVSAGLLGDPLYGDDASDRGYLHAFALNFEFNNQQYQFESLPNDGEHFCSSDFHQAVKQYHNPWALPWPKYSRQS